MQLSPLVQPPTRPQQHPYHPVTGARPDAAAPTHDADLRLTRDNSRALPSEQVVPDAQGRIQVSADIQELLGLSDRLVDLNAQEIEDEESTFGPLVRARRGDAAPVAAATVSVRATESPRHRYLTRTTFQLLQELTQRAIGYGPNDPGELPGLDVAPETRRLGAMVRALQNQPGREADALRLLNAAMSLNNFFIEYRTLIAHLRTRRPNPRPVLPEYAAELAREPLRHALQAPVGADGLRQYDAAHYAGSMAALRQPVHLHEAALFARLLEFRRFSGQTVPEMLGEAAQRAIGSGPADARPQTNTAMSPESHRLNEMVRTLRTMPDRQADALLLRHAGQLLREFFIDFRRLMQTLRNQRPDLEPVLDAWSVETARGPVQNALTAPGINEPGFVVDERTAWNLGASVRRPLAFYTEVLDRRMRAYREKQFLDSFPVFFERMSRPRQAGVFTADCIAGAGADERGEAVKKLLEGEVVLSSTEADLAAHLRRVPAAVIGGIDVSRIYTMVGGGMVTRHGANYPSRGINTIRDVWWQAPDGKSTRVIVTDRMGMHSYSMDDGLTWHPTGAPTSPALDAQRADRWAGFLAQRRLESLAATGARGDGAASGGVAS